MSQFQLFLQIVLLYLDSPADQTYTSVSESVQEVLQTAGITVRHVKTWTQPYHHGYTENPFIELLRSTYEDTRSKLLFFKLNFSRIRKISIKTA